MLLTGVCLSGHLGRNAVSHAVEVPKFDIVHALTLFLPTVEKIALISEFLKKPRNVVTNHVPSTVGLLNGPLIRNAVFHVEKVFKIDTAHAQIRSQHTEEKIALALEHSRKSRNVK